MASQINTPLLRRPGVQAPLLLFPAIAVYAVFAVYPLIDVFVVSFQQWNGIAPERVWVGLDNYSAALFRDPVFHVALRNTAIWTVLSMIFPPLVGLVLALALNQPIFGRGLLRTVFYLPVIIASIGVATIWRWMYDPFFGAVNAVLNGVGVDVGMRDWLGDQDIALYSIFVAYVWQNAGASMVLFLAGLQGVDKSLVEAARIDGARRWNVFRHVTFPALRPVLTIVIVLSIINSLRAFDIVYGMTKGGPAQATQMLALWAFTQSMQIFEFGRGAAISVMLLVITAAIVIPYLTWMRRLEARGGR
jgi:raffinose/stachyose/melibiose transport system permease protein